MTGGVQPLGKAPPRGCVQRKPQRTQSVRVNYLIMGEKRGRERVFARGDFSEN